MSLFLKILYKRALKPGPCAAVKQSIITYAADNEIYSLCPSNLSNSPS